MREREVEAYLVKRVEELGGIAYKFTSPNRVNVPDRLVLLPGGIVFFVECKSLTGNPTDGQQRELTRLRELGQEAYVVRSKDTVDYMLAGVVIGADE